jgi:hypothetical protein
MDSKEKQTLSWCKKLHELPPVVTDWQQTAWCPDCDHYNRGRCSNPNAGCPFDGKASPLREVADQAPNDQPRKRLDGGLCEVPESHVRSKALEQAVMGRIVNRTWGRMQALAIELTDGELVVRGSSPCHYVKQLALQAVLDVLSSDSSTKIGINFQVVVRPRAPDPYERVSS